MRPNHPLQWTGPGVSVVQVSQLSGRPRPLNGVALSTRAIQEWTLIKLVGPAASDAADRFDRWWAARVSEDDDPFGFAATEWSPSIKREASAYLSRLIEHRWGMPVAYFSQHVDWWRAGGGIIGRFPDEPEPVVWHDAGELWCYRLPDGAS